MGPPRTPERTTKNMAQPVLVSEPAEASARQHVRKPETREHGHPLPEVPATLSPAPHPFWVFLNGRQQLEKDQPVNCSRISQVISQSDFYAPALS